MDALHKENGSGGALAIFHLSVKTFSRRAGQSAVAAAAYRAGADLHDERTGQPANYSRRRGIAGSFIVLPDDAPAWMHDRSMLWNVAEHVERRCDATVAREWELALPVRLSTAAREQLVRRFCQKLIERYGVACDVAIHLPSGQGDERNHHAHILTSTRAVTKTGFAKTKTRILDGGKTGKLEVLAMREIWAQLMNEALAAARLPERVDHRSHKDRGLVDIPPQIHEGVNATGAGRRGESLVSFPVIERGRIIDYPKIDGGQTRAQHNAEIIQLQKYRPKETTAEELARLTAQLNDTGGNIAALEAKLASGILPDSALVKIRLAIEYLRCTIARKAYEESEYIRIVHETKKAEKQLKEQEIYYARLQTLQLDAKERYEQERAAAAANRQLVENISRMAASLNGIPPFVIKLEVPLAAKLNEAVYMGQLQKQSTAELLEKVLSKPQQPAKPALATVTLRQDVLQVKELLSRARLPTTPAKSAPISRIPPLTARFRT